MANLPGDKYMLQVFKDGKWVDVDWVSLRTCSREARECTRKTQKAHRVINITNNALVVECTVL